MRGLIKNDLSAIGICLFVLGAGWFVLSNSSNPVLDEWVPVIMFLTLGGLGVSVLCFLGHAFGVGEHSDEYMQTHADLPDD